MKPFSLNDYIRTGADLPPGRLLLYQILMAMRPTGLTKLLFDGNVGTQAFETVRGDSSTAERLRQATEHLEDLARSTQDLHDFILDQGPLTPDELLTMPPTWRRGYFLEIADFIAHNGRKKLADDHEKYRRFYLARMKNDPPVAM